MWGNRTGWVISACLAAVCGFALVLSAMPAGMEAPTGKLAAVGMQVAALPVDPLSIFKPGTTDQDAAYLYREAMSDFDRHSKNYQDWQANVASVTTEPLGISKIIEARDCAKMNLFAKDPSELINYENNTPSLTAIHTVATLMDQMAYLAAKTNNPAKARKYGEALFALGYNLFRERVRFTEWNEGVQLMGDAAKDLGAADPAKSSDFANFSDSNDKYMTDKVSPVWQKLDGIDPLGYSGDIYEIAQPSNPEVMWRVEAILRLGRLTYFAPTRGDQLVTRHFLEKLANDPSEDRLVHAAATAAYTLMQHPEQYHQIGLSTE